MKLPDVSALAHQYYSPDNPERYWYMVMTFCLFLLLFKGTRRLGGISFCTVFFAKFIWNGLWTMYQNFTPSA